MTREEAYLLLTTHLHNKNLIKHCLSAEVAMKGIYKYLYKDDYDEQTEQMWGIVGLLHDGDYEVAQRENKIDKHGLLLFDIANVEIPEQIAHAIKAHNYTNTLVRPESDLDWAIACVDGLTGLIVACALVTPDKKLSALTPEFVLKKFGQKSFAAGAHRETIGLCDTKLSIPLKDFISITLSSMQEISTELGL